MSNALSENATPRVKIICSLGPATDTPEAVRALVDAGMDAARLNFSHGTHDQHRAHYERVRAASDAAGRAVGIMADLSGPKIRLGVFPAGPVSLETGAEFVITTEPVAGDAHQASTTYEGLARDVKPGDVLLVNDGLVRLEALASDGVRVTCRVLEGGEVSDHKGINLPGVKVSAPALTPKDIEDLRFALELGVDMVALSFVRSADAAVEVRRVMDAAGRRVPVFAKLEKPEAVLQLEAIVKAFDGVLVARGDLGVEMSPEAVPAAQKRIIECANIEGRLVITATQMLDSMINNPRPTRAEASDVANAILDGTDAVMLSGETAAGKYPLKAVQMMNAIICEAETHMQRWSHWHGESKPESPNDDTFFMAMAARELAQDKNVAAIAVFTQTGRTAMLMSKSRPGVPILAFTPHTSVYNRLAMFWGVSAHLVEQASTIEEMIAEVESALLSSTLVQEGQQVVLTCGYPVGELRPTNMALLHTVGSAID